MSFYEFDLFIECLKYFTRHNNPTEDGSLLLILDNHDSHYTLPAFFLQTN